METVHGIMPVFTLISKIPKKEIDDYEIDSLAV